MHMRNLAFVRIPFVAMLCAIFCAATSGKNIGERAPDFSWTDMNGQSLTLAQQRGKIVLINFWATWCGPCREEMPEFAKWQRSYDAQGLLVIGVSMDDQASDVKAFIRKRPTNYPIVMGDAKMAESFGGVLGLPLSYIIDRQGRIVARYQGEANLPKMEATLKALLTENKSR